MAVTRRSLVWVDRHGSATPLGTELRSYIHPWLSPDGERLALSIGDTANRDIWIYELTRDRLTKLTTDGKSSNAVWSPDGTRIAFSSDVSGPLNICLRASDGSGPIERLLTSDLNQLPTSWSPDGRMLAFTATDADPKNLQDIWALSLEDPSTPRPVIRAPNSQLGARISPDGHWLAYV